MPHEEIPNIGAPASGREQQEQQHDPQRSQTGQQRQQQGDHRDADHGEEQDPESVRGGRRGGYGQGASGGIDVGAIEPGRTQNNGSIDS